MLENLANLPELKIHDLRVRERGRNRKERDKKSSLDWPVRWLQIESGSLTFTENVHELSTVETFSERERRPFGNPTSTHWKWQYDASG